MINPPLNYTGSKFKVLDQILPLFDYSKESFIDLFCGGGSVYANVSDKYKRILINDIIEDLILIHKNLIEDSDNFIEGVHSIMVKSKDDKDSFHELRDSYNMDKTPQKLWALMLSCTNNMMRFNKQFKFNQTFGKRIWNSSTDRKVELFVEHMQSYKDRILYESRNFYEIVPFESSMIYIDPPYTNTEAGYNSYWSVELEHRLYDYIMDIHNSGHSFMLSGIKGKHKDHKESELIHSLLQFGFNHRIIELNYEKVARKKHSKESQEIVIFNY